MTIISISGFPHNVQSQSHRKECWIPDFIAVPPELENDVWESAGYCDLTIEDGILVDITPKEKPVAPPAPPTELEQLRADVDFLAAIGGVEL